MDMVGISNGTSTLGKSPDVPKKVKHQVNI